MLEKDQAICLRAVNYSDTSQVVTLMTRDHGKIACMAKGSKRPKSAMDGAIEPFSFGPAVFSAPKEDGLTTLSEFSQQLRFRPLRQNLFALNCGLLAAELMESLTEMNDPHPQLFDAFVHFLDSVQSVSQTASQLAHMIVFELTLLQEIGIGPVTGRCANCSDAFGSRWKYAYFSTEAKGLLCPGCENAFVEKIRLEIHAAAALSEPQRLSKTSEALLRQIQNAMLHHFTQLLHRPLKLAQWFLS